MSLNNEEFMELVEKVWAFHDRRAPGIAIACEMVNRALEKLGEVKKLCAVAETRTCLPDCIQYIAHCTIGNGDLKMMNGIGRYALTLYDRKNNGKGVRIFVDIRKIEKEKMPETYKFFRRERSEAVKAGGPERKASNKIVVEEFLANGRDIFSMEDVFVTCLEKPPLNNCCVCEECGESFTMEQGESKRCTVCSGEMNYYRKA